MHASTVLRPEKQVLGTPGGKEATVAGEQGTDHPCVGLREGLGGAPFLGTSENDKGAQSSLPHSLGKGVWGDLLTLKRTGVSMALPRLARVLGPLTRHPLCFSALKEQRLGRNRNVDKATG